MKEKLTQLLQEGQEKIRAARSEGELQEVKGLLLGKQGALTGLLKELPRLDVSLRPEMGKAVNQAKTQLTELLEAKREELKLKASEVDPDFDITVPGTAPLSGGLHPITQMCYDLNDAFRSMGFEIFEESDITSELYGFDNLNFPPNHPARESMDTYWLEGHDKGQCWEKLCLRPHLTGGSVRYMQTHKPPYRFVYPGRVYRNDARFGNKWALLVVVILNENGSTRFNQLARQIPDISTKVLSNTLQILEADGLVKRTVFPEVPIRVEYELTATGKSLVPIIISLTEWAQNNMQSIMEHRKKFESLS